MQKDCFKLINNVIFGKTMEILRNHRDIKLITIAGKRELFSFGTKLSCNKNLFRKFIRHRNKKILMKTPVYSGLSILIMSKTVAWVLVWLCEIKIWRKSQIMLHGNRLLCILHKNRRNLCRYCKRCWIRFDAGNYEFKMPWPKGKNKKVMEKSKKN